MDLSKVLTISGKNGLFQIVSQSKNSVIVESLTDGKKIPVFATERSSSLQDISVFTHGEDMPLKDILLKIFEKEEGKPSLDPKSNSEELRAYFETIVPEYDKDRVYNSDIKKIFSWYNLLVEKEMISKEAKEDVDADADQSTEKPKQEGPDTLAKAEAKPGAKKGGRKKQTDAKPQKIDTGKRKTLQKK